MAVAAATLLSGAIVASASAEETTPNMLGDAAVSPLASPVAAADEADGSNGYLWLHFVESDYENIRFGYSADGVNWSKLNGDKPVIQSHVGRRGIRDPHLVKLQQPDADGYKYVMIGTDLHAEGTAGDKGWSQQTQSLIVSRSKDLLSWTEAKAVDGGWDNADRMWAPEAIWNPETNDYIVYYSSKPKGGNLLGVYKVHTKDFKTFTQPEGVTGDPQPWVDQSGSNQNVIDSTIVKGDDGDYYRFSTSDWWTVVDTATSLEGKWTRIVERDNAINADGTSKNTGDKVVMNTTQAGLGGIEGLTVFQKPNGSWVIMGDNQGYKAFAIDKLSNLKKGIGTTKDTSVKFSGRFRHGTIVPLTAAEQQALTTGTFSVIPNEPVAEGQAWEENFGIDVSDGSENATLKAEGDYGKVLNLNSGWTGGTASADGPGNAMGRFSAPEVFNQTDWTLYADVRMKGIDGTNAAKQDAFTIGTADQAINLLLGNGTLGYGTTKDGLSGKTAKLSDTAENDKWASVAMVYSESSSAARAAGDGTVAVYLDGEQVLAPTDIGFKLSEQQGTKAFVGHGFNTSFALTGSYDNIVVKNSAASQADAEKETADRAASKQEPEPEPEPANSQIAQYDFENAANRGEDTKGDNDLKFFGEPEFGVPGDWNTNVMQLRPNKNAYAEFPTGMFDGRDSFTLEFESKSRAKSGNFFSFAIGNDQNKYVIIRLRGNEVVAGITTSTYSGEQKATASVDTLGWHRYTMTFAPDRIAIYVDGQLKAENTEVTVEMSDLGENLKAYIGKSVYAGDSLWDGGVDKIKIYNYAKSEFDVVGMGAALKVKDNDQVLSQNGVTNEDGSVTKNIVLDYWSDPQTGTKSDKSKVSFEYEIPEGVTVADVDGKQLTVDDLNKIADYSEPLKLKLTYDGKTMDYTVGVEVLVTPIRISGDEGEETGIGEKDPTGNTGWKFFADPQVVAYDGKYYIFPTTDGYSGWQGHSIHVFESTDLVNWKDQGTVVDLAKDYGDMPDNRKEKAWAPGFAIRDGKFYLYFSGGGMVNVAVSNSITSGYKIQSTKVASSIDPVAFEDPATGKWWLAWGNSAAKLAELNDDMTSVKEDTTQDLTKKLPEFREGMYLTARKDPSNDKQWIYYISYSVDDTSSPNYHVQYSYAKGESLDAIEVDDWKHGGAILQQDTAKGILGTAHHSILQVPGTDDWYIVYHAFLTDEMRPRGYDSTHNNAQLANGNKREVRIARMTYDADGQINVVPVTYEGVLPETTPAVTVSGVAESGDTAIGTKLTAAFNDGWKGVKYQWYRADNADAEPVAIAGATNADYTLTNDDADKLITVKAVGESATGVRQNAQQTDTAAPLSRTNELDGDKTVTVGDKIVNPEPEPTPDPDPTPGGNGGGVVSPSEPEVVVPPADTELGFGEDLDLSGVKVDFGDGKQVGVEDMTVSGYDSSKPGVQKVTLASKADPSKKVTISVLVMFKDVDETTPHHEEIRTILEHDITRGFADGTFQGMSTLKRQDLAAFLYRLAGQPDYEPAEEDFVFADVTTATPHYKEILWAAKQGVVQGYLAADGTRTFAGGADIKRQDMIAMLYRLAGSPESEDGASFGDVSDATPHHEAIEWAKSAGVTTGFPDGTFRGGNTIVRQDTAAFLGRMIDKNLVKL